MFRTHPIEKSKLVFQIGSANADLALEAALTVYAHVSWQINMINENDMSPND